MASVMLSLGQLFEYLEANPQSRNIVEGESVANAGHVVTLGVLNGDGNAIKIFALCLKTSGLSERPHEITGHLEKNTNFLKIVSMKCTCKAGLSERCKHIAAVLILCTRRSLADLDKLSSTDVNCYWSKKVYLEKYARVPLCQYKCTAVSQHTDVLNSHEEQWVVDFLTQKLPSSSLAKQIQGRVPSSTIKQTSDGNYDEQIKDILRLSNRSNLTSMLDVVTPIRQCCNDVLNGLKCDVMDVCIKTKNNKEKWMQERQFRVTASRCYTLYTYKGRDWTAKAFSYFWPKSFSNKFVKHGRKYEAAAREAYKEITKTTVIETGLIICEKHPWLACSPDGIVVDSDGNPQVLLEIKCPYAGIHCGALDFIEQCPCLQVNNNEITLKKTHIYYGQIQLSLSILDLSLCHFILYSSNTEELLTLVVERDDDFCNDLLQTLQHNYFTHMIHSICEHQI